MPKQIYHFNLRGDSLSSGTRVASKDDADQLYAAVATALENGDQFIELNYGSDLVTVRAANIAGFGITVQLEETSEERKARAIAHIESQQFDAYSIPAAACNVDYEYQKVGYAGSLI